MSNLEVVCSIQRVTASQLVETLTIDGSLHLFLGTGSRVQLYELVLDTWILLYCGDILHGRVIHGFRIGPTKEMAVFGQKVVAVVTLTQSSHQSLRLQTPLREFNDWILDLIWFADSSKYALLTAHNRLLVVCSTTGTVLHTYTSSVNCILYSAKLLHSCCEEAIMSVSDIYVAAGTVFNDVIMWNVDSNSEMRKSSLLHTLSGHKGVIFAINVNYKSQLLCSVSDDRTIHLWKWEYLDSGLKTWRNAAFHLVGALHGHTARVWQATILNSDTVISIGEDANIIVWNTDGSIRKRTKAHKRKNIWCMSVNSEYMVTGGGDSSVKVWQLSRFLPSTDDVDSVVLERFSAVQLNDFPRSVCFQSDVCLMMTDQGCLQARHLKQVKQSEAKLLFQDRRFSGYTVMCCAGTLVGDVPVIAIGSTAGILRLVVIENDISIKVVKDFELLRSKVMSLTWLESSEQLLVTDTDGEMTLYNINIDVNIPDIGISLVGRYRLPRSKQRFISCACVAVEGTSEYLICADMVGAVHVYVYDLREQDSQNALSQSPEYSVEKIHGKVGLTDMHFYDNYLHTVGRDGYYRRWSLVSGKLESSSQFKISQQFDWLARLIFDDEGKMTIIVFHNTEVLLYDMSSEQVMLRVECGGGHRNWDFTQDDNCLYFAYIKDKTTNIVSKAARLPCTKLVNEFHSGKITGCQMFEMLSRDILVTCSDDGSVIVSELVTSGIGDQQVTGGTGDQQVTSGTGDQLVTSGTGYIRKTISNTLIHISSAKCVVCTHSISNPDGMIIISGGGRAQLLISLLTADQLGQLSATSIASLNVTKGTSMMRKNQREDNSEEPDVRIMAVTTVPIQGGSHLIAAACSDGTIKFILFDEVTRLLRLVPNQVYLHSHCLLTLDCVHVNTELDLLVAGATDGSVILINLTQVADSITKALPSLLSTKLTKAAFLNPEDSTTNIQPLMVVKAHQSGVNAICVQSHTNHRGNKLVLYSGGDDNCIVVSDIDLITKQVTQERLDQHHSAQITGIQVIGVEQFVSCSIDQRLHTWSVNHDAATSPDAAASRWEVTSTKFVSIPDVSCLSSHRNLVAIVGDGLEIYSYLSL